MAGQTSVKPLILFNVDWTNFIKNVAALTGHSPTRGLDASGLKLGGYTRFIAALGEFQSGKALNPFDTLKSNNHLLRHLFFGFLVSGSTSLIYRIMELTDLNVTSAKAKDKGRVAVVSGTLEEWKAAIITCLDKSLVRNFELRWVFNSCLDIFYSAGLRNVFDDYRKKGLEDQTYLLEYKK